MAKAIPVLRNQELHRTRVLAPLQPRAHGLLRKLASFAAICLATSAAAETRSPSAISTPLVVASPESSFETRVISPRACEVLLGGPKAEASLWKAIRRTIVSANRSFLRRGWGAEFLAERFTLARDAIARSEYINLIAGKRGIVATIGWTFAEYDAHSLPDPNLPADQSRQKTRFLPEEISLRITPLERPVGKDGRGLLIELRSWSIAKDRLTPIERAEAFTETIARSYEHIFERLSQYSEEFLDLPVIHLYADEKSLKLYSRLGFEATHLVPVLSKGTHWWDMAITPRNFEKIIEKMQQPAVIEHLNREIELQFGEQKVRVAQGGSFIRHDFRSQGYDTFRNLAEPTVFRKPESGLERIVAAKGATVGRFSTGELAFVTNLAEPLTVHDSFGNLLKIDQGGSISWNKQGQVIRVWRLAEPAEVGRHRIPVAQGGSVHWHSDGRFLKLAEPLAREVNLVPGVTFARGASVSWAWANEHPDYVSIISGRAHFPDGAIAEDGSQVEWQLFGRHLEDRTFVATSVRWSAITRLAEPMRFSDTVIAPKGARVHHIDFIRPPEIIITD